VSGLKKKITAPAPRTAVPNTTTEKTASDGGAAFLIFGGTACDTAGMVQDG
jgi:hypothetical protein